MGIRLEITEGEKQTRMPRAYSIPNLEGQIAVHENNILVLEQSVEAERNKILSVTKMIAAIREAEAN